MLDECIFATHFTCAASKVFKEVATANRLIKHGLIKSFVVVESIERTFQAYSVTFSPAAESFVRTRKCAWWRRNEKRYNFRKTDRSTRGGKRETAWRKGDESLRFGIWHAYLKHRDRRREGGSRVGRPCRPSCQVTWPCVKGLRFSSLDFSSTDLTDRRAKSDWYSSATGFALIMRYYSEIAPLARSSLMAF